MGVVVKSAWKVQCCPCVLQRSASTAARTVTSSSSPRLSCWTTRSSPAAPLTLPSPWWRRTSRRSSRMRMTFRTCMKSRSVKSVTKSSQTYKGRRRCLKRGWMGQVLWWLQLGRAGHQNLINSPFYRNQRWRWAGFLCQLVFHGTKSNRV